MTSLPQPVSHSVDSSKSSSSSSSTTTVFRNRPFLIFVISFTTITLIFLYLFKVSMITFEAEDVDESQQQTSSSSDVLQNGDEVGTSGTSSIGVASPPSQVIISNKQQNTISSSSKKKQQRPTSSRFIFLPDENSARKKPTNAEAEKQEREVQAAAAANLREPTDPARCRRGKRTLENHPTLVEKYGTLEQGGWCELITTPVPELSGLKRSDMGFRSRLYHDELIVGGEDGKEEDAKNKKAKKKKTSSLESEERKRVHNDSTYFDYRASSDGVAWPYSQCPIKHEIVCHSEDLRIQHERNIAKNDQKTLASVFPPMFIKSRALVVFIVSSAHDWWQRHREQENLLFFLEHGLVPANTSTALFDEVDFVFAKIQHNKDEHAPSTSTKYHNCGTFEEADMIRKKLMAKNEKNTGGHQEPKLPNIRFIMLPSGPCDLCAHARILDYLDILDADNDKQNSYEHQLEIAKKGHGYSMIIMANSGIQGPFFVNDEAMPNNHKDDDDQQNRHHPPTTWIDYVAMGGRRKIPNPRIGFFHHRINERKSGSSRNAQDLDDSEWEECPIHIVSGSSVSWEGPAHIQTFFLAAPFETVRARYFGLFTSNCKADVKGGCIIGGEIKTGKVLLETSATGGIYSLGKQFHIRDMAVESRLRERQFYLPRKNPVYTWQDVCKAVVVKTGGGRVRDVIPRTANAVNKLVEGMTSMMMNNVKNGKKRLTRVMDEEDFLSIHAMFKEKGCAWNFLNTTSASTTTT